jgi:hypothetical protein
MEGLIGLRDQGLVACMVFLKRHDLNRAAEGA